MNKTGTYRGFLCFMPGELYIGEKDGIPHVEFSELDIGAMHIAGKNACICGDGISFVMEVNELDGAVTLTAENGRLTGEMFVKEVDMHFSIDLEKTSDSCEFSEEYYIIPEKNREILKYNRTFEDGPAEIFSTWELGNREVLEVAEAMGIAVENHHDFATICALMRKTEAVIHQDGVNYCHSRDHGTLAQLHQALAHNHYTNCRGISIVYAGILRAYGFHASYVECWPADPTSQEIHVVCEVYVPDLEKFVVVDISNRLIFFKNGVPLSLLELRETIANGEEGQITANPEIRHTLEENLSYLSKNLAVFCKQARSNEADEIQKDNSICLVPRELRALFSQWKHIQYFTSNPGDFYTK